MSPACYEIAKRQSRQRFIVYDWATSWEQGHSWTWSKSFWDELTRPPGFGS